MKDWNNQEQEFTPLEELEAQDFADLVESHCLPREALIAIYGDENANVGTRLYIIQECPPEDLILALSCEPDDRLDIIARRRDNELNS